MDTFHREVGCLIFPGTDFVSITTDNSPGSVEFDFFRCWEYYKENKSKIDCLAMLHTHPPGIDFKSSTDENMVDGWYKAFGKNFPINYYILQPCYEIGYCNPHNKNEWFKDHDTDLIHQGLIYLSYKEQNPTPDELKFCEGLCQTALHMGW